MLSESRLQVPAAIVNRNGAKGCLTLTSDDGDPRTSDFFYTVMAPRYPAFRIAVAVPLRFIVSSIASGRITRNEKP